MTTENGLSKEWSKFDPAVGYEKAMQDVKLKNGDIVYGCWPNAGVWNVCFKQKDSAMAKKYHNKEIDCMQTDEVRLHKSEIIL